MIPVVDKEVQAYQTDLLMLEAKLAEVTLRMITLHHYTIRCCDFLQFPSQKSLGDEHYSCPEFICLMIHFVSGKEAADHKSSKAKAGN